jgi:H+/gluconate symporter-like permease
MGKSEEMLSVGNSFIIPVIPVIIIIVNIIITTILPSEHASLSPPRGSHLSCKRSAQAVGNLNAPNKNPRCQTTLHIQ